MSRFTYRLLLTLLAVAYLAVIGYGAVFTFTPLLAAYGWFKVLYTLVGLALSGFAIGFITPWIYFTYHASRPQATPKQETKERHHA